MPNDSNQTKVRAEQIAQLYARLSWVLVGIVVIAAAVAYLFWERVAPGVAAIWFAVFLLISAARYVLLKHYRRASDQRDNFSKWGKLFVVGTFASGVAWGVASVVFFIPGDITYVLLLSCIYAGVVSSATGALSAYLPAYISFLAPAMLPLAIRMIIEGGDIYLPIGALIFLYFVACVVFAIGLNRAVVESIALRFENLELIEALEDQRDRAETAIVEKNRFLAAASHDLRQPLHAIGLFLDNLKPHISKPEGEHIFNKIEQSIKALGGLFSALLDISRLDAGVIEPTFSDCEIHRLMDDLRNDFAPLANECGLRFECKMEPAIIRSDPVLLKRIASNLLANAVNFTRDGEITVSGRLGENDDYLFIVQDTGIGIPASDLDAIFSEYHQLNNPERDRAKGLGLGLAIVKRLCSLIDANISVQSQVGNGSTFTLRLPLGEVVLSLPQTDTGAAHRSLSGLSVILVDDEQDILEGMQNIFERWQCTAHCASNADDALRLVTSEAIEPELLVCDYRLPGPQNGIELIRAIREELNHPVPAILITGDTGPERLREAAASQLIVLHKPIAPPDLRVAIEAALVP